jgi:hypothetical protein
MRVLQYKDIMLFGITHDSLGNRTGGAEQGWIGEKKCGIYDNLLAKVSWIKQICLNTNI